MADLSKNRHINVQQRCNEYLALKALGGQCPADIYKGTPVNEDQLNLEGYDLELTFLDDYVQQQVV